MVSLHISTPHSLGLAFFRNDGSSKAPHFVLASDDYLGRRVGRRAVPRFLDNVLIVRTEQGGRDSVLGVRLPPYAAPAFADLRGVGEPDLFVGEAGGGIVYFSAKPRHF